MYFGPLGRSCQPSLCSYCRRDPESQQHKLLIRLSAAGSFPQCSWPIQSSGLENQTVYSNVLQLCKKQGIQDFQDQKATQHHCGCTGSSGSISLSLSVLKFRVYLLLWAPCTPVLSFTSSTSCRLEQCNHYLSTLLLIIKLLVVKKKTATRSNQPSYSS